MKTKNGSYVPFKNFRKENKIHLAVYALTTGRFEDDGQDGASPYILRLFCIDGRCEWETLPQRLKFPRFDAIAVKTPYDFVVAAK